MRIGLAWHLTELDGQSKLENLFTNYTLNAH